MSLVYNLHIALRSALFLIRFFSFTLERIHNDGNCEDLIGIPEEFDPILLEDIKLFASTFYCQFQDAIVELRDAMQQAIRDCAAMEHSC